MEYENFDISIERSGDRYKASLIGTDVKAFLGDEIDEPEMRRKLAILEKSFPDGEIPEDLREVIEQPEQFPIDGAFLKEFGNSLYKCLFRDDLRDAFKEACGRVSADGFGLRVRLMIVPPDIARWPWELMYDKHFLATSDKTSIVRFPGTSEKKRKLTVNWPVKVLIAIPDADKKDSTGVNGELEKQIVREAFKELTDARMVELDFMDDEISTISIDRKLSETEYHIFHYIGHGCFENEEGYLKIKRCGADGKEEPAGKLEKPGWLRAASFATLFSNHPSMKLVVLNSCQGAKVSSITRLSGVAPKLVDTGIPAVVAMQYPIFDDSARTFAQKFYGSLCKGRHRGLLDVAMTGARNLMLANRLDDPDFATPVLFMRTDSGLIFDLNTTPHTQFSSIQTDRPQDTTPVPIAKLYEPIELMGEAPRLKALQIARKENLVALDHEKEAASTEEDRRTIEQYIVEEKAKLADVEQRLGRVAKVWMRLIWAAFLVSCIVLVGAFFGVFNVVKVGDYLNDFRYQQIRHATGAAGFGNDHIRVILVEPNERLNGFPHSAEDRRLDREYHAQLIDALANAGAKVVALDIVMDEDKISPFDKQLADSIDKARGKGTHVISGVELKENAEPQKKPPPELVNALNDRLGNVNVGLDYQLGSLSFDGFRPVIRHVELAKDKPQEASNGLVPVYPSLMLQAIRLFKATSATDISQPYLDRRGNQPRIVLLTQNGEVVEDIPVVDEDMSFTIAPGPDSELKAVRHTYKEVFNKRNDPEFMGDYRNKLVLVGYGVDEDDVYVSTTHRRYGVELQAEAVSNIFQKIYIKNVPWTLNLAITFAMILIGLLLTQEPLDKLNYRSRTDIKVLRNLLRVPIGLILVTIIYFLIVWIVYAKSTYLIEMSYHVFALFAGYLVGVYRRRRKLKEGVAKV